MTINRAVSLLSQMFLPHFDDEEKEALTMAIDAIQKIENMNLLKNTQTGCLEGKDENKV